MRPVWLCLLFLCSVARAAPPGGAAPKSAAVSARNGARAERLGLGSLRAAGKLLAGEPEPRWIPGAPKAALFGTLSMPVPSGAQSRGFGSGAGGYHQAIDIVAKLGSRVVAAAPGIVGYAGSEVRGYGNLILLVHEGGAVTAYAHNRKNLVAAGQRVARGALIALLGSTGLSKGPHVHFELLFGGENCDPGPLIRPALGTAKGPLAGYPLVRWRRADKRPPQVACHARKHHPGSAKPDPAHEDAQDEPDP